MSRYYIGLSTSGHDPSFCIVNSDGQVLFAEATERFLQDKRAWGVMPDHISHIESVLKPLISKDNKAEFIVATSWKAVKEELPVQISDALLPASLGEWIRHQQGYVQARAGNHCRMALGERMLGDVRHYDHHLCHAANALYSSPFTDGLCLVLDGEGEVGAASLFELNDGALKRAWRSWGPGSLGALYGWLTELCGFSTRHGEEWKVMGLAAYGQADEHLVADIKSIIQVDSGRLQLSDKERIREVVTSLQRLARKPEDSILSQARLAMSAQQAYTELVDQILDDIKTQYPQAANLLLSGGCALNSLYNGRIRRQHGYEQVHAPPAPADDGNSLGAAILAWAEDNSASRLPSGYLSPYLGSTIASSDIEAVARYSGLTVTTLPDEHAELVANELASGKVIGVARGRAEFGPRALGNRSILADPRSPEMKDRINAIIKGRESYRPFAPALPEELIQDWFDDAHPSPYMSFALPWKKEKRAFAPAVVHNDGSGRLQSVSPARSPWFHRLLHAFADITGTPVLLNTSFNVMGKPIVHSAHDAISVLMTTGLDAVLLDNHYIQKKR
ncbi:predicted carbamoyl transferase, NodU family [Hahella chejuensis KCTC 2396]|uniref:Predicted carbamoyl transferase, NodU family n=1 Tax=Hahella chejuensis (strain KCTC 2396) TaxID=349521 RepID=Q2SG81_HAHCH|nr:carbamoyltransferase C-terminal domain-containing protein [Hahella chejuensis]ABC30343.1 predicted carbamoyl transferase, NodU family [Hahella chejuensis KCTC 2396]